MVPIDEKQEKSKAPVPDVKLHDPIHDPRASTTEEDIARAEGEGMLPAPPPDVAPLPPTRARRGKKPARVAH